MLDTSSGNRYNSSYLIQLVHLVVRDEKRTENCQIYYLLKSHPQNHTILLLISKFRRI